MTHGLPLFDVSAKVPQAIMGSRDGETFNRDRDMERLDNAMGRIWRFMQDRQWHSVKEIAEAGQCSEAGATARIRDLRKPKFGGYIIDTSHAGRGVWKYLFAGKAEPMP